MAGTGKKWLMGCGLGCGIPLVLAIVLSVGGSIVMMKPFNRAVSAQKELVAAYGDRADYVPGADGIRPDRIEKFMAVRRALQPLCDEFSAMDRTFKRMDELEQDGEEPSKTETFKAVGDVMGAAFGLAGNIGRFSETRNQALLQQEMGLGEYIWIYVMVYHSWLGYPPNTGFDADEKGHGSARERKVIRGFVAAHGQALVDAGQGEEGAAWLAEAKRLERSEGPGAPWAGGEFPAALAADLEPYRAQLDALYCAASTSFEFSQLRKRGLSVTSN